MRRNNIQLNFVGGEREGKTYLAKKYAKAYLGKKVGGIIAYNFGDFDFPESEYLEIKPLTFQEHLAYFHKEKNQARFYRLNKTVDYFWHEGKVYHFKYFNQMFGLRKVRIAKVYNRALERAFVTALFRYVSGFLLILDDTKMIFTNGLTSEFQQLFGRKNHTGKESNFPKVLGLDIITIFHSLDSVNPEIWDYCNTLVLFKTTVFPTFRKVQDKEMIKIIKLSWEWLRTAPKYSAIKIDLKGEDRLKPKKI